MTIWFTSDTHFGHNRIITYCSRPFIDSIEMEEVMIERFNSRVRPGDLLYHLGDVCWSSYPLTPRSSPTSNGKHGFFDRINCHQFQLILGNHDGKKIEEYKSRFVWVGDYKKIKVGDIEVVLSHYPFRTWVGRGHGTYHLYGHIHNRLPGDGRSMDVGVDALDFYPISLEEVVEKLKDKPFYAEEP